MLTHPGYFFDFPRESFLVVSLLPPEATFATASRVSCGTSIAAPARHECSTGRRRAGLLIPLFSCPSTASWGIGDIGDVEPVTAWLAAAGQRVLQLLPLNEMAPGQQSPYSAISAMAIDPIFIQRAAACPSSRRSAARRRCAPAIATALAAVRRAPRIDHRTVRRLKQRALRAAFERFLERRMAPRHRARARAARVRRASRRGGSRTTACSARFTCANTSGRGPNGRPSCSAASRRRSIARAASSPTKCCSISTCSGSPARSGSRRAQHTHGVALFGDLPFMVDGDSADVWARQHQFRLDVSVGAPPDAFSATGQDWGMPLYHWDAWRAEDFRWLRERARRSADLFDGYRVDHLVGFYRTYGRPKDGGEAFFTPADEPAQLALGERLLELFRGAGRRDHRRGSRHRARLRPRVARAARRARVSACFRWERHWHTDGQPFRDPSEYPPLSVAASGTHDTEPLAVWWDGAPEDERAQGEPRCRRSSGSPAAPISSHAPFDAAVRDVLLEALFASGSDLLLLPMQDAFGWRDRINEPATVSDENWTFRLPWPVDRLDEVPEARERKDQLRAWAEKYGRRMTENQSRNSECCTLPILTSAFDLLRLRRAPPGRRAPASAAACAAASRRGSRCCSTNDATMTALRIMSFGLDALVDVHVRVVRPRVVLDSSWMNWKPGRPTAS